MLVIVERSAIGTDIGVEDAAERIATVALVAKSIDSQATVVGTANAAPDLGRIGFGSLGQVEESFDVSLLEGVLDDALGIGVVVVTIVWVGSLLELVAIVATERLATSIEVVDSVAWALHPPVSSLFAVATVSTVSSEWAVIEASKATIISASAPVLGGDNSGEESATSSEFHLLKRLGN